MEKTMNATVNNTKGMKSVADITRQYGLMVVRLFNSYKYSDPEHYRKRYNLIRKIAETYLHNLQHNGYISWFVNIHDYLDGNQGERCGTEIKAPMECRLRRLEN